MIISGRLINMGKNIVCSILLSVVFLFFHFSGYYDFVLRLIASIGLIPVISMFILAIRTREIRIVVMSVVLFQTWNMFLEPYMWKLPIISVYRVFYEEDFFLMALFSCLSIFALYIGFLWGIRRIKAKALYKPNFLSNKKLGKLLIGMILLGFVNSILSSLDLPLGIFSLIETMLPSTVGAITLLYWIRGGRSFILILFSLVYMICYFIYYVGGTLFIYSIFLVMAPTVIYIIEKKKIPYKVLTIVVILLLPIYLSRHSYRNEGLLARGIVRIQVGLHVIQSEYSNISIEHWKDLLAAGEENKNVDNRTEGVSYLGQLVQKINSGECKYLYGRTMIWFPTMIIPRFLIPFRPSQNMGDGWAIYYGLKDPTWRASINFPMLCEFYVNFGYWGMVIFSFINGLLIVWFMRKFNDGIGDSNLLLLIFLITKIIVVEANVSLAYGAVIQVIFICWFINRFFLHKSSVKAVNS